MSSLALLQKLHMLYDARANSVVTGQYDTVRRGPSLAEMDISLVYLERAWSRGQ
jgi:hypothetical protein